MAGFAVCMATALLLYALSTRADREDSIQLRKLAESPLYQALRQQMRVLNHQDIDEIRIECSGITVTSVCPAHIVLSFSFKQNGNSLRNDSFTRLYAELIARDLPMLTERRAYKLRRYRVYRPNGREERAYAFIMRRGYKDYLLAERCPAQLRIY